MEEILLAINPWWKEKKINEELAKPYKREVFKQFLKLVDYRQLLILTGLRRVGKSTLMFQLIDHLIKKTGEAEKILYFSFDLKVDELIKILNVYKELTNVEWKKEKVFVFFDEVQKLSDWASKLKLLYDNFPKIKFIVSGSSSVAIEKEAISTLTGRYFLINVDPLNFREFLELKKSKIELEKSSLWENEIKKEFYKYLKKPFPEITGWKSDLLIRKYLRESVIDKVIRKDLPDKFKDVNEDLLTKLIEIFYSEPGMYLNYDNLSSDLKISKKTLLKHMFYLEFAYLIRRVRNFRSKVLTASKKLQRVYPYHWSLIFPYGKKNIYECFVASIIDAKYYWRNSSMREVDFIIIKEDGKKNLVPIEVKSEELWKKEDLKNLVYFCKRNELKRAFFIYAGNEKTEKIENENITIKFIPFWKFALIESTEKF